MSRRILKICIDKFKSLPRDENGAAMMITLAVVLFLYLLCSSSYAIGMTINEKIQLQNAADAAAYSAAVVEADGLSRIATINRAMSWTYIQTVKRRMDYIVLEWLNLTARRFREDEEMCRNFNNHNYNDFWFPMTAPDGYSYTSHRCGMHESGSQGAATWWCGWQPDSPGTIKVGYLTSDEDKKIKDANFQFGRMLTCDVIQNSLLQDYAALSKQLRNLMDNDNEVLSNLSALQVSCILSMRETMKEAALTILQKNLPYTSNTGDEYFYRIELPACNYPYSTFEGKDAEAFGGELWDGIFSAYKNTEEDELEFLSASIDKSDLSTNEMKDIWKNNVQYQDILGDGIDQWFIRGCQDTFFTDDNANSFNAKIDDYAMRGIQRGYKSANRAEALLGTSVLRGNHVAWGNPLPVTTAMVLAIPQWAKKTLTPVTVSLGQIGLRFSQAASVFAKGRTSDIIPSAINSKNIFVEQCQSDAMKNNYGLVAEYHWSSMRWWCAQRWKWIKIWWVRIPVPVGVYCYKADPISSCSVHGDGNTGSNSRKSYVPCYVGKNMLDISTHNSENAFPGHMTMGYSRIYGDDNAVFNRVYYDYDNETKTTKKRENRNYYITPKVMPIKLNRSFFQERISVAVGKKQKNVFFWMFNSDSASNGIVNNKSIFSMFNPVMQKKDKSDSLLLATSSATAAFRSRRADDHYETCYDQLTTFEYDENFTEENSSVKLFHNSGIANIDREAFNRLRFGCPHRITENELGNRLKNVWNLCETDWQPVFVPHRYANEKYQGYCINDNGAFFPYDSKTLAETNDASVIYRPYRGDFSDFIRNIGRLDQNNRYLIPLYESGDLSSDGRLRTQVFSAKDESAIYFTPTQLADRLQKFKLQ